MDWNWFFGAPAQSAAAIVGIFAAFIIMKIVGNQTEHRRKKSRLKELIAQSLRVRDAAANRYFEWYNSRRNEDAMDEARESVQRDRTVRSAEEYYRECGFSPFFPKAQALQMIQDLIEGENGQAGDRGILDNSSRLTPLISTPGRDITRALHSSQLRSALRSESDAIDRLIEEANHNIRTIRNFLDEVDGNPEHSTLLTGSIVVIVVLFYTGVVYPLSFLPCAADAPPSICIGAFVGTLFSLKGMILALVSVVFTFSMAVFLVINRQLRYDVNQVGDLRKYIDIRSYSEYLGTYQDNMTPQGSGEPE